MYEHLLTLISVQFKAVLQFSGCKQFHKSCAYSSTNFLVIKDYSFTTQMMRPNLNTFTN